MITLTRINNKKIAINISQIEYIEEIPETKIVMMNGKFHIIKESLDEMLEKIIEYNKKIFVDINRTN